MKNVFMFQNKIRKIWIGLLRIKKPAKPSLYFFHLSQMISQWWCGGARGGGGIGKFAMHCIPLLFLGFITFPFFLPGSGLHNSLRLSFSRWNFCKIIIYKIMTCHWLIVRWHTVILRIIKLLKFFLFKDNFLNKSHACVLFFLLSKASQSKNI